MSLWQENRGKVKLHPFPCTLPGAKGFGFVPLLVKFIFPPSLFLCACVLKSPHVHENWLAYPKDRLTWKKGAWVYLDLYLLCFTVPASSLEGTVVIVIVMISELYRHIYRDGIV